ncbi:MAG: efflux RND transporter periplasmic adaptor subunit [candidate division KSB1 bacterium]|jgi:RND family efflux transporter MFP subunit|nr:efflux RND transporter periplasmic adaptor subunit [candidate division KSB1 bacterium]
MKKIYIILVPVAILIAGFILMRVLLGSREAPTKRTVTQRPRVVGAKVAELKNIPSNIIAYGRLASAQPVTLTSEVSGTIMSGNVKFQPAQSFRKGDLLLKIDDRQLVLDLNSAKSDFLNALASVLPELKVDFPEEYQRFQDYFNRSSFEKKIERLPDTENQKVKLFLTRFNVYKLYFAVRNLEILLEKHYFYAPFDGSIISTELRAGSNARVGTRLGEILNLEDMEVELPIPAIDIQWIDEKQPVVFTSSELKGIWKGRINRIGKSIDPQSQTVAVYASVEKSAIKDLYTGIFLKAEIPGSVIGNALMMPRSAIYEKRYAYFIEDGVLAYNPVQIAFENPDTYIINSGVQNGDTLITDVLQGVAPGMLVTADINDPEEGADNE